MCIDGDGKIGIGTISPTKLLHLSGGSSPTLKISASDATPGIFMADADRTSQDQHLGEFQALWNGNLAGRIVIVAGPDTTNKDDGHMDFYTSNGGSNGHRMRIKHDGKIGIGMTDPAVALDVQGGTSNTGIAVRSTDTRAQVSYIDNATTGLGCVCTGAEGDDFFIRTGSDGAKKLTIKADGKVGIGTTGPSHLLDVEMGAADYLTYGSNPRLHLRVPDGTNGMKISATTTPLEIKNSDENGRSFGFGSGGA